MDVAASKLLPGPLYSAVQSWSPPADAAATAATTSAAASASGIADRRPNPIRTCIVTPSSRREPVPPQPRPNEYGKRAVAVRRTGSDRFGLGRVGTGRAPRPKPPRIRLAASGDPR